MTADQLLERIKEGEKPNATPHHWEWVWTLNGQSVTRQMNTLRKRGLVNIVYHRGFASVSA